MSEILNKECMIFDGPERTLIMYIRDMQEAMDRVSEGGSVACVYVDAARIVFDSESPKTWTFFDSTIRVPNNVIMIPDRG